MLLGLPMEDPTPPSVDTPPGVGDDKTWRFEGPNYIGSL